MYNSIHAFFKVGGTKACLLRVLHDRCTTLSCLIPRKGITTVLSLLSCQEQEAKTQEITDKEKGLQRSIQQRYNYKRVPRTGGIL